LKTHPGPVAVAEFLALSGRNSFAHPQAHTCRRVATLQIHSARNLGFASEAVA